MPELKNILVVYGDRAGDKAALEAAVDLSKRSEARLEVVEFVVAMRRRWWRAAKAESQPGDPAEAEDRWWQTAVAPGQGSEASDAERIEKHLARSIEPVRQQGIQVKAMALAGTPFVEIIREVVRENHDLLVIAAEQRAGAVSKLSRSTAMQLLRRCPCPVWVTKPGSGQGHGRILAALDPDSSDPERTALNLAIMDLATSIARLENGTLHVVHAWELAGRDLDRSRSEITPEAMNELLSENQEARQRQLDEVLDGFRLEDVSHHVHLVRGSPETVILDLAAREKVDLIVMGTISRTGVLGFLMGNTAERILQRAECSVLTVKPEEFVTSVAPDA